MTLGDPEVRHQECDGLGRHRGAAISMDRELPHLDSLRSAAGLDELLREDARLARGDHVGDDVAAEDVEHHVEVEVGPLLRAEQLGDVPRPNLVGRVGDELGPRVGGMAELVTALPDLLRAFEEAVIIISDGDPQPPPPALLASYQASRITVSAVTVFPHGRVDTGTMQAIANATGGRYYMPSSPDELPAIFIKEAKTSRTPAIVETTFTPGVMMPAPVLKGIDALPPLHGMVLTTPKGRALTVLEGPDPERSEPVLAQWRYGVGAAAAFTSDLGGRWGRDWVGWEHYRAFVHQLVSDVARQPRPERLFARALAVFGTGLLQVEDHGTDDALLDLRAEMRGPQGTVALDLTQVGPRRYEARFPLPGVGRYEVSVSAGNDRAHVGLAVPYGGEYTRFRSDPERLRQIVARTGARLLRGDERGGELFARPDVLLIGHARSGGADRGRICASLGRLSSP